MLNHKNYHNCRGVNHDPSPRPEARGRRQWSTRGTWQQAGAEGRHRKGAGAGAEGPLQLVQQPEPEQLSTRNSGRKEQPPPPPPPQQQQQQRFIDPVAVSSAAPESPVRPPRPSRPSRQRRKPGATASLDVQMPAASPAAAWQRKTAAVEADKQHQAQILVAAGSDDDQGLRVIVLYGQALQMLQGASEKPGTPPAIRCAQNLRATCIILLAWPC